MVSLGSSAHFWFESHLASIHPRLLESADSPVRGVRLWLAQVEALSRGEVEELRAPLDAAERARAARFHFERDRQNYIATRGLLRRLLAAALNADASVLAFRYGAHGKPALAFQHDPALRFNVSHSRGWAMFAVSLGRAVGIDLESAHRLQPDDEFLFPLAERILSARELEIWRELPGVGARHAAFLRAWTRKEAYAKAIGEGVFAGFRGIEVALDAAAPSILSEDVGSKGERSLTSSWTLHDLRAPAGFCAALAVEETGENAQGSTPRYL